MIISSKIKLLVPSTTYGNITIEGECILDSAKDMGRIEVEAKKRRLLEGEVTTDTIQNLSNELALELVQKQKEEIDKLSKEFFVLS